MIQTFQNIFIELTIYDQIFLAIFCLLFFLRFLYLFLFTGRVLFRKKRNIENSEKYPFSLIFTVRNQEENLKNNLPKVLIQEGVDFEVIVVDDFSQDNSFLVLGLLKERYKRLKISMLNQETRFSTKQAQNIALKAAENNWVLTNPTSIFEFHSEWLSTFAKVLNEEKNLVVGYSNVKYSKGFFNHLYRIESYFQFVKSAGFVLNRIPILYSEDNVAFQKKKYFEMDGYSKKITEPFANLELLFNSFSRKKTTTVLFEKETSVRKKELVKCENYLDLLKKSFRIEKHLSASKKAVLLFEEITRLIFLPITIFVILLYSELWPLIVTLLGLKVLAHLLIIKILQNRLNERKIFISSLVYQFIIPYFKLFYRWYFNHRMKKHGWRNKI